MKSDIEIAKFVRSKIIGSELAEAVDNRISDRGRPSGSDKEDIVIAVLSNEGAGQYQQAFVNVNVYVKDLWNDKTSAWEQDTIRLKALCEKCKFLFSIRGGDFHAVPSQSLQKIMSTGVSFEDGHTEHFINNKIYIEINNE